MVKFREKQKSPPTEKADFFSFFTYGRCYSFLRGFAVFIVFCAFFALCVKAFSHVHLEIDVPEHVWEQMERDERRDANDRVQNDPERASQSDRDKAGQHQVENMG